MGLGWFLVPAIGGYWFLTHLHYTRYRAARDSGYHLLFRSALVGVFLYVFAQGIVFTLNNWLPEVSALWQPYLPDPYSDAAILSVALGFALPWAGNRFFNEAQAARKVAQDSGDFIELLIADSIESQELVELSLRNRKVYIGLALAGGIGKSVAGDVMLIPMNSGYRDKDTRELKITTHYAAVIKQSLEKQPALSDEDFRIVIPMSEIVSARLFFPEAYELFQEIDETVPSGPPDSR